jgi:hypothetical protein
MEIAISGNVMMHEDLVKTNPCHSWLRAKGFGIGQYMYQIIEPFSLWTVLSYCKPWKPKDSIVRMN